MEKEQLLKTNFVTVEEWKLTPSPVKDLVVQQKLRIEEQSIITHRSLKFLGSNL